MPACSFFFKIQPFFLFSYISFMSSLLVMMFLVTFKWTEYALSVFMLYLVLHIETWYFVHLFSYRDNPLRIWATGEFWQARQGEREVGTQLPQSSHLRSRMPYHKSEAESYWKWNVRKDNNTEVDVVWMFFAPQRSEQDT